MGHLARRRLFYLALLTWLRMDLALFSVYVPPECKNPVIISDASRSKNNVGGRVSCDQRNLPTVGKWHRFMGAAGNSMPTSCVPKNRCGTHAPGWLSGGHPSEEQGVVTRKVCFHWNNNCCLWSVNIKVRNCGEYYVYQLLKTPVCNLRYCAEKTGKMSMLFLTGKKTVLLFFCGLSDFNLKKCPVMTHIVNFILQ